ncbi:MAG: septal ring lytic transglycosylase RlpA family protein [Terriglobales bacterium]
MRRLAEGLAILLSVASLGAGAASGPSSLEAAKVTPHPVMATGVLKTGKTNSPKREVFKGRAYQTGTASWYGVQFQGKQTASGEPFDMRDFTAAHPSLPLGTFVKVTNLKNGKAVVVRINDRGPVVDGRIIDVSYNAALALGFKEHGLQKVRLDLYQPTKQPTTVAMLQPVAKLN